MEIILRNFKNIEIFFSQDNDSIYINATKIAKEFETAKGNKKDVSEWLNSKNTQEYLFEMSKVVTPDFFGKLVMTNNFGAVKERGTWIHKKLIIAFARWLSLEFAVWCDLTIEELLKNNSTQQQTPIFDTSSFSSEKLLDVQKTLLGLETAIKILKVSEASKLLMTETIYRELGIKTEFLPKYSDEKHTYSLTHLLKKFGSNISAQKVNQKLLEIGILEIKTRKSHKKEKISQMLLELEFNNIDENNKSETIREFKSLTEKGLKFGKNLINPNNELQTQPHYFESSFAELLNLI
jgi:hypothetical protein